MKNLLKGHSVSTCNQHIAATHNQQYVDSDYGRQPGTWNQQTEGYDRGRQLGQQPEPGIDCVRPNSKLVAKGLSIKT